MNRRHVRWAGCQFHIGARLNCCGRNSDTDNIGVMPNLKSIYNLRTNGVVLFPDSGR
jgi:hypothetical protein